MMAKVRRRATSRPSSCNCCSGTAVMRAAQHREEAGSSRGCRVAKDRTNRTYRTNRTDRTQGVSRFLSVLFVLLPLPQSEQLQLARVPRLRRRELAGRVVVQLRGSPVAQCFIHGGQVEAQGG